MRRHSEMAQHFDKDGHAMDGILECLELEIRQNDMDGFRCCMAQIKQYEQEGSTCHARFREETRWTTSLQMAAVHGSSEMVEGLIALGVPFDCAGDIRKRTPLHFACYSGHTETARCLLAKGANPEREDSYGRNCLHLAIRAHHKATVKLLLEHPQWKEMMKKCDDSKLKEPLKTLIVEMPDLAEVALSKCVHTNEGQQVRTVDEVYPYSEEYEVTYDYKLLEGLTEHQRKSHQQSFKKGHPLYLVMESNRSNLLKHPLVTSFVNEKWRSFGRFIFFTNFTLYLMFLMPLTVYAISLTTSSPSKQACDAAIDGHELENYACEGLTTSKHNSSFASTVAFLLAVIKLVLELFKLRRLDYLRNWMKWVETPLYFISIIFVAVGPQFDHRIWQLGVLAIFLGWIVLIGYLQEWPFTGVYVLMLIHIIKSFLKVAFLALLLVVAFALTFYMQFFQLKEMQNIFSHPGYALMKVLAMTTGELDYNTIFQQKYDEPDGTLAPISYLLFIVFVVVMPVLLINLLTALAVGDVKDVQEIAKESRIKLQIDLVLSVEEVLQSVHLRHLFPPVILDPPRSIRINTPNTLLSEWCDRLKIPKFITEFYLQWFVSDPFFMTGEELADAINQPVSTKEHLSEQLHQLAAKHDKTSDEIKQLTNDVASIKKAVEELLKKFSE